MAPTIDAHGNLHDQAGKFDGKHNSAPAGALDGGGWDSPVPSGFSGALLTTQAAHKRVEALMSRDALAEIARIAPREADSFEIKSDGVQSFVEYRDEEGNTFHVNADQQETADRAANLVAAAGGWVHSIGFWKYPTEETRWQQLMDSSLRARIADGLAEQTSASEQLDDDAVAYAQIAAPGYRVVLDDSDQGDYFTIDSMFRHHDEDPEEVEIDPYDHERYDSIETAVGLISDKHRLIAEGRARDLGHGKWELVAL